ncbi:MAG: glutamate--tRNA ligase [Sphingomonadales bacterium]
MPGPIVRFAPSPTGEIHVGNVRAALMNWLFSQQKGGTFVLRLDDTDQERSTKEFAQGIRDDLKWLGITPAKEYKQSDRIYQYDVARDKLITNGRLYPCFETPEELDLKRRMLLNRKMPPIYDRAGLKLTDDEKSVFEVKGIMPHWRFKLDTDKRVEFVDMIRGSVSLDPASVSDPVLIRADGSYLYSLPSVVDDIDMEITHVVRGEDHVTNSGVQAQIFDALGSTAPEFAHFSLLTGADGSGLSKRHGALSIRELREIGIEPMALISLLSHLGTSDAIQPYLEPGPLIEGFLFSKLSRSTAKFNDKELLSINAKILHKLSFSEVKKRSGLEDLDGSFWRAVRPNISLLSELDVWYNICYGNVNPIIEDKDFIKITHDLFPEGDVTEATWSEWTMAIKEVTGAKGKELFFPLRQALTGMDHGPEMRFLLPLMGAKKVRERLS